MAKYRYDLHIHSTLSPCGDDDMTPVNIVATASAMGIDIVAIADHNAIKNVEAAMEVGEVLGVTVVPAFELQTNEDIHLLCLFPDFDRLSAFHKKINFTELKNREDVFGRQLVVNSDDEVVEVEDSLLLAAAEISEAEAYHLARRYGGVCVPAHIDRDGFGMLSMLGGIPPYYKAVEVSCDGKGLPDTTGYFVLHDSDAHTLVSIGKGVHFLELSEPTPEALIDLLVN
ncbi:MAG: PHP domain-containing protein [Clostridia bacterium]|nr:PHP domain-containing protein [Clostridia bacterium]